MKAFTTDRVVLVGAELGAPYAASPSFLNMCATATPLAASAVSREENRGVHERVDFPEALGGPAKRSQIYLADAIALRTQIVEDH